jgi:hypothetical protein
VYASPESLAAQLVDNMDQDVASEFAQAGADASCFKRGHVIIAAGAIKAHVEQLLTKEGRAKWQLPSRWAKGAGKEETCSTQKEKPMLSEDNKEHLKVIVAALISDMMPSIQRLVASDPRIQRFSLSNSPRFKEQIIKEYKAQLAERRKSEVALLRAASTMSKANVSTQAYRAIRSILVGMGFRNVLPTERDLSEARANIEECAKEDLVLTGTRDGWFVSPTAVLELDLARRMEMVNAKNTRFESGGRLVGHIGPGMHGWQDVVNSKISLDCRTVTRKQCSTEVTMQNFATGRQGEADSHRALSLRTLGIWMGKDSRENVQGNLKDCLHEIQQLADHGIVFNREKGTFLGQAAIFRTLTEQEQQATFGVLGEKKYCPVKVNIIFVGDMAGQCAVIGHGCAGNHYCAHCMAHQEDRHLPYALITTEEDTTLQALAQKYDMHSRTLYAINTRLDHKNVQRLTCEGLRSSTAMDAAARAQAQRSEAEKEREAADGSRRPAKKAKKAPVAKSDPDEAVLKRLVGWGSHALDCRCKLCIIPKGTCVRVIPNFGFSRPSDFLKEHCPAITAEKCPFCVLHCNMRVTESLFHQICQAASSSAKDTRLIDNMNSALAELGINRSYKQSVVTGKYEKVTFEGHQALDLLATDSNGKMGIERVLEAMWPGAAEDPGVGKAYGTKFVPRTIEVWRQWAVVVKLMTARFSEKLEKDVVDGEDGFQRFGKECREFIFRFQSMSTVDYSKSYYLHTLLHHAGDFMRELRKMGLTLGMMSNSGVERRHEYGRRATRKALASNGWRKKRADYADRPNLLAYLTVKEILMFEYGEDLVSYEMARLCREEDSAGTRELLPGARVDWQVKSLRASLLSEEELRQEYEAGPDAPPPSFETSDTKIWGERGKKKAYAMIGMKFEGESEVKSFDPDLQGILFDGMPVYVTDDESVAGSEEDFDDLNINSFEFPEDDEDDSEHEYTNLAEDEECELREEQLEWMEEDQPEGKTLALAAGHDENDTSGSAAVSRAASVRIASRMRGTPSSEAQAAQGSPAQSAMVQAAAAEAVAVLTLQSAAAGQAAPSAAAGPAAPSQGSQSATVQAAAAVLPFHHFTSPTFQFVGSTHRDDEDYGARRPAPPTKSRPPQRGRGRR